MRSSGAQLLSASQPAFFDDLTAGSCPHAFHEAVFPFALPFLRLKRHFHIYAPPNIANNSVKIIQAQDSTCQLALGDGSNGSLTCSDRVSGGRPRPDQFRSCRPRPAAYKAIVRPDRFQSAYGFPAKQVFGEKRKNAGAAAAHLRDKRTTVQHLLSKQRDFRDIMTCCGS